MGIHMEDLPPDVPTSEIDRAIYLQNLMIARATGGNASDHEYMALRRYFIDKQELADVVPRVLRTCRDLSAFWAWAKKESETYDGRRRSLYAEFQPLLDKLEGCHRAPLDQGASDTLRSFDVDGVHAVWTKALSRRESDPEGAIT